MNWRIYGLCGLVLLNGLVWFSYKMKQRAELNSPDRPDKVASTAAPSRRAALEAEPQLEVDVTTSAPPVAPSMDAPAPQNTTAPAPRLSLDSSGGADTFDISAVKGLKKMKVKTGGGNVVEYLDFTYYDPHPDYRRVVHVRMPAYYAKERRTTEGWYSRFRWWEVRDELHDSERAARMAGAATGSEYLRRASR